MTPQDSNWGELTPTAVAELKHAVAEGIREALTDPATTDAMVTSFYDAFQRHAQQAAGRAVVSTAKTVATKGLVWFMVGLGIYSLGGWAAVVGAWKLLVAKGS
jgi:hypothetical protein